MFYVDFELALVVTFGLTETDVIVNLDIDSKTWEDILFARAKPKELMMEFSGEKLCILKTWRMNVIIIIIIIIIFRCLDC